MHMHTTLIKLGGLLPILFNYESRREMAEEGSRGNEGGTRGK